MSETRKMAITYENARSLKGCPFEKMLTEHKESAVYYWDNRLDKEFLEYYKKNVKEDVIKTPFNVTDIIYRMREYPSMRVILDKYNIDWKTNIKKKYGKIPTVISKKHPLKANLHGTFMDYVIRHRLSAELNIDFQDSRVEVIIKGVFPGNDEVDKSVIDEIEQSYSICKTNNRTYEILDHLLIISRAHSFYFGEIVRKQIYNKTILPKSIQEALEEYINSITFYSNIGLNPVVGNRNIGIGGDADIINGTEIIDIKTSTKSDVDSLTWYQLLLYASLHWYNTGILIKTLTVFNPLYGTTRTITLETEENLFKDVLDWVVSKTNGEKLTYCPKDILDIKPIKVNRVIYNFDDDEQCTAIKTDGKRCTFTSTKDTLCTRHYNKKNGLSIRKRVGDEKTYELPYFYSNNDVKIRSIERDLWEINIGDKTFYLDHEVEHTRYNIHEALFCLIHPDEKTIYTKTWEIYERYHETIICPENADQIEIPKETRLIIEKVILSLLTEQLDIKYGQVYPQISFTVNKSWKSIYSFNFIYNKKDHPNYLIVDGHGDFICRKCGRNNKHYKPALNFFVKSNLTPFEDLLYLIDDNY